MGAVSSAGDLLPFGDVGLVVVLEPAGLGVGHCCTQLIEERFSAQVETVTVREQDIHTLGINGVSIDIGGIVTAHGVRVASAVPGKDVVGVIVEGVDFAAQQAVPQGEVHAHIIGQGLFPAQVLVGDARSIIGRYCGTARIYDLGTQGILAQEHVGTHAVVTKKTYAGADFQVVQER